MEATTERHGRTNGGKVPQEVALKIKAEGPKTLDHYFKLWMQCNCQWGRVTIVEKLVEIEIHSKESSKLWFTEKELVDNFGEEALEDMYRSFGAPNVGRKPLRLFAGLEV